MSGTACDVDCIDYPAARRARTAAESLASTEVLPVLRALADPIRLRLLAAAAEQPGLCACDLAWIVDRQKSLVSHHLKHLRDAGLLGSQRDGRLMRFFPTSIGDLLLETLVAAIDGRVAA